MIERLFTTALMAAALIWSTLCFGVVFHGLGKPGPATATARTPVALQRVTITPARTLAAVPAAQRPAPLTVIE